MLTMCTQVLWEWSTADCRERPDRSQVRRIIYARPFTQHLAAHGQVPGLGTSIEFFWLLVLDCFKWFQIILNFPPQYLVTLDDCSIGIADFGTLNVSSDA